MFCPHEAVGTSRTFPQHSSTNQTFSNLVTRVLLTQLIAMGTNRFIFVELKLVVQLPREKIYENKNRGNKCNNSSKYYLLEYYLRNQFSVFKLLLFLNREARRLGYISTSMLFVVYHHQSS